MYSLTCLCIGFGTWAQRRLNILGRANFGFSRCFSSVYVLFCITPTFSRHFCGGPHQTFYGGPWPGGRPVCPALNPALFHGAFKVARHKPYKYIFLENIKYNYHYRLLYNLPIYYSWENRRWPCFLLTNLRQKTICILQRFDNLLRVCCH